MVKIRGKQVRYWDVNGNPQLPSHVVNSEIDLSPVRTESLTDKHEVLVKTSLIRNYFGELTPANCFIKDVVYVFPKEEKKRELKNNCDDCIYFLKGTNKINKICINECVNYSEKIVEKRNCKNCKSYTAHGISFKCVECYAPMLNNWSKKESQIVKQDCSECGNAKCDNFGVCVEVYNCCYFREKG